MHIFWGFSLNPVYWSTMSLGVYLTKKKKNKQPGKSTSWNFQSLLLLHTACSCAQFFLALQTLGDEVYAKKELHHSAFHSHLFISLKQLINNWNNGVSKFIHLLYLNFYHKLLKMYLLLNSHSWRWLRGFEWGTEWILMNMTLYQSDQWIVRYEGLIHTRCKYLFLKAWPLSTQLQVSILIQPVELHDRQEGKVKNPVKVHSPGQ